LEQNGIKMIQNHQSLLSGIFILPCEMQHIYTCYDQRRICHVGLSLNVIITVLNIYMKHQVRKCMDP